MREASQTSVFRFDLKTAEARRMVYVASSQKLRKNREKDDRFDDVGCGTAEVGPNYP
jgi:hypothetical protein